MFTDMVLIGRWIRRDNGRKSGYFQTFYRENGKEKARGACHSTALVEIDLSYTQGVTATGPRGRGFIVGMSPKLGLPLPPCMLAMRMVDSEVVPQQSFLGQ
jgi:hypothetical protein